MMQTLVLEIKKDPNYIKFARIVETVRKRVDVDASLAEALALHTSRTSRSLSGEAKYSPNAIIDASLKDLSFRARLVEIRVSNSIQISILAEAIDSIKRHISTEYAEDLKEFSTAEQRRAFVDRVIKQAHKFLTEANALLSTLDILIKDIDQGGYSLKNVVECLKIVAGLGNKVV